MNLSRAAAIVLLSIVPAACGGSASEDSSNEDQGETSVTSAAKKADAGAGSTSGSADAGKSSGKPTASDATIATGLTSDFQSWLKANGYTDDFVRADVPGGSFGGRTSAGQTVAHNPIVFVHGNSDSALGTGTALTTGWVASTSYFLSQGYTSAELYGTTWGPANELLSAEQDHSRAYVGYTRRFLQAVLAYTGASKIDVISHSMGVTLSRAAIIGGKTVDAQGSYNIGASLGGSVDTFIGISGANLGLTDCYTTEEYATCGDVAGFYPGVYTFAGVTDRSTFLNNLLAHKGGEASYRYAMFSTADEVISYGDIVYGSYTSSLPGETGEKVFDSYPYGHVGSKDETGDEQYKMVTQHKI